MKFDGFSEVGYPTKIVAIGLNYYDHAEEMKKDPPKEPLMFLKPVSSLITWNEDIIYPNHMSSKVDYEGELGIVIKKEAKWVSKEKAYDYILGGVCVNDVTARDLQSVDIQFSRAKGFDTFCPVGPYISCLLYTSPSPRDATLSRMPSSA